MVDDDLPDDWQQLDGLASYLLAVAAIGEAVKAGAELPSMFVPQARTTHAEAQDDAEPPGGQT